MPGRRFAILFLLNLFEMIEIFQWKSILRQQVLTRVLATVESPVCAIVWRLQRVQRVQNELLANCLTVSQTVPQHGKGHNEIISLLNFQLKIEISNENFLMKRSTWR